MHKMTLLEMVQNILSAMNSDEVNSIGDTVESQQVAREIETTFYELYGNRDLGTFESLVTLQSPGNTATPHIMTAPANVSFVKWIKYKNFKAPGTTFKEVLYLEPEEFIERVVEQPTPASSVMVTLTPGSTVTYPINNKKAPDFYTILDDGQTFVFDSFDSTSEAFLTQNNSLAWGVLFKTFTQLDSFIPPIDASLFPHFLAECRSVCFINIKEVANSKEEQRARRQLVRTQTRVAGRSAAQRKSSFSNVDYSRRRG